MRPISIRDLYEQVMMEAKKKAEDDIEECDIVAGGAGMSDVVANGSGMTASDVLGKCHHDDNKGFFGKDCFHIPKPVFKKPLKRTGKNGIIVDAERKE